MAATKKPDDKGFQSYLAAIEWLMSYLESSHTPCLVRDVQREAKKEGMSPALLRKAAQALPIIRRPRELRGPWAWKLPEPEELVRVRYQCPLVACGKESEGWMEFRLSRILFSAGLIRYLTRGTARRTQPPDGSTIFLRLSDQNETPNQP